MPSQNPQHSVAIAHGGSAGDGLIAGIGVAYKGDRFKAGRERSALVSPPASAGAEPWCPSSRATWEGVHRCVSCLEPGACITEKIGAFCDFNCLTWKNSHLESNQVGYFSF